MGALGPYQGATLHFYWTSHPASSVLEHVYLSFGAGLVGGWGVEDNNPLQERGNTETQEEKLRGSWEEDGEESLPWH